MLCYALQMCAVCAVRMHASTSLASFAYACMHGSVGVCQSSTDFYFMFLFSPKRLA